MCGETRACGRVNVGGELVVPSFWGAVGGLDRLMAHALALERKR